MDTEDIECRVVSCRVESESKMNASVHVHVVHGCVW